jgi:uncharacterized protein
MMDALTEYGRPLYDRARILVVNPLSPSEVHALLDWDAADVLDAYAVVGGFPNLVLMLRAFETLQGFLGHHLQDPVSPLIVSGERSLASEFPSEINARVVLDAIGTGEREHGAISSTSGISGSALERALDLLVAKRIVSRQRPYSSETSKRNTRYLVTDPYLRFWLRWAGPLLPEIERGRGHLVARRVIDGLPQFTGKSIEPIVRESLTRMLPARRFGSAQHVGSYWTRDGSIEVDLVGGLSELSAKEVGFIGSVKWRQRLPFNAHDLAALINARDRVPGATEKTKLIGVSHSGYNTDGLDVELSPEDIVTAW